MLLFRTEYVKDLDNMKINDISDIKNNLESLDLEEKFETVKKLIEPICSYLQLQGIDPFLVIQNMYLMLNSSNSRKFIMDAEHILNSDDSSWLTKSNREAPMNDLSQPNSHQNQEIQRPTLVNSLKNSQTSISTPVNFHSLAIEQEKVKESLPPTPIKNLNNPFTQNHDHHEKPKDHISQPSMSAIKNLNNNFIQNHNNEQPKDALNNNQPIKNINYGNMQFRQTLNTKINVAAIQEDFYHSLPLNEGIKYLIPIITEKGINALKDPSISNETYNILKLINGVNTLEEINEKNFSNVNNNFIFSLATMKSMGFPSEFIVSFIVKIISISSEGFVTFMKKNEIPKDKKLSIKLGELLLYMKLLDDEKLEKCLEIQKAWKPQINSLSTTKPLLGNLLLSMDLLGQSQLSQALEIQKWYNSMRNI